MIDRLLIAALILLPSVATGAQQAPAAPSPAPSRAARAAAAPSQASTPTPAPTPTIARAPLAAFGFLSEPGSAEWAARYPQDPADSTYREARSLLNRGEWRRASVLFGQVAQRQPASAYAADALYWQAFALYRIGGVTELREALAALDARKSRFPRAGNADEAETLTTRVSGALAARGDASAQSRVRASASGAATSCDTEELSVRASALSVLMRSNPDAAMPIAIKVLERRDECSVSLRRNAVMMVGNTGDAAARAKLFDVAKSDPSPSVRSEAIGYLAKSGDEVVPALETVIRSDESESVQRAAVRALGANESPKARAAIRALVERTSAPERLRLEALSTFDRSAGFLYSNYCIPGEECAGLSMTAPVAVSGNLMWPTPVPPVPAVAPVAPVAPMTPMVPRSTASTQAREVERETQRAVAAEARAMAAEERAMVRARAVTVDGSEFALSRWRDDVADRRITAEDAAWLRGVYPRLESTRLKSRAALVLARADDDATSTWLMALVQREDEPADVRAAILSRLGRDLPIAQLNRLYDGASSRTMRQQVVQVLGDRPEPEATDKLIEIVRSGTDPQLRRAAITALNGKKDPRTTQLLLELIDR